MKKNMKRALNVDRNQMKVISIMCVRSTRVTQTRLFSLSENNQFILQALSRMSVFSIFYENEDETPRKQFCELTAGSRGTRARFSSVPAARFRWLVCVGFDKQFNFDSRLFAKLFLANLFDNDAACEMGSRNGDVEGFGDWKSGSHNHRRFSH